MTALPHPATADATDPAADLDRALEALGGLVTVQLDVAMGVVIGRSRAEGDDRALVIARHQQVTALEQQVNDRVIRLLAQPTERLDTHRTAVAAVKVAAMLERAGDAAVALARQGATPKVHSCVPVAGPLGRLGHQVSTLLTDALTAFRREDGALAATVRQRRDDIDALQSGLFRQLLTYMLEDLRTLSVCSHQIAAMKLLERVADQAAAIAAARAPLDPADHTEATGPDATNRWGAPGHPWVLAAS